MKRRALVLCMLVLACIFCCSGCANNRVWVNSSKTSEQGQKDFSECKYDSEKSSFVPYSKVTSPISAGIQEGFQNVRLMSSCMESRGYHVENRDAHNKEVDFYAISNNGITEAFKQGDYNKTIELANIHIERYPYSADIITIRATSYQNIHKCDLAVKDFEYALKLMREGMNSSYDSKFIAYTGKAFLLG